ncbi:hypothetical protein LIS04_158 [Listeria phage LIS04]|nr:hypothetical protein LIS04_158 [Listeria phage LIS04]
MSSRFELTNNFITKYWNQSIHSNHIYYVRAGFDTLQYNMSSKEFKFNNLDISKDEATRLFETRVLTRRNAVRYFSQ